MSDNDDHSARFEALERRLERLEQDTGIMRMQMPTPQRILSSREVAEFLKADSSTKFVVCEGYKSFGVEIHPNARIGINEYPQLASLVSSGLRLTAEAPTH